MIKRIKKIYGLMNREERKDHSRLLVLEINSCLKKIYTIIGIKNHLEPQKITADNVILKNASLGATKMWEFRLNKKEDAARGDVGKVVVATRILGDNTVRKQIALFIAAEFYVYHAFANDESKRYFESIISQNQYTDIFRRVLGAENAHDTRDRAVRYVIEEIGEHKLAHSRGKGWYVNISKVKKHNPEIAKILGSSERTFREILRKQHQVFSQEMLVQEKDLIQKEREDLNHLIVLLKKHQSRKVPADMIKLSNKHIETLEEFRQYLDDIIGNIGRWIFVDRQEHTELKSRFHISSANIRELLKAEAEAEQIDINKIHIIFNHLKKEKINILRDLEMLDSMSEKNRAEDKQ